MKRLMIATCCACVFGLSGIAAAQDAKMDKSMAKEMKVTGCVAQGAEMDHYMLNNAVMSDMDSTKMGTMKKDDMKKDDMKKDAMKTMSYMLMGGDLKAHVGHKVEVTGMMADANTMAKDTMPKETMPKDTMTKGMMDMHTLNVKSVKMLSPTCN